MDPQHHPRLLAWIQDNPSDPDRPSLNNPDVQRLVAAISPDSCATDLGGTMSLNVKLDADEIVLRVHQPFVSRQRLFAVQQVRCMLSKHGYMVPVALPWRGSTVIGCGRRWAELEQYIPHQKPEPTLNSYLWLFESMGTLHRALATYEGTVPRSLAATYGPPNTLRRWLPVTQAAVQSDNEAAEVALLLRRLVNQLRQQWLPASRLPQQCIHGDVRLGNVCMSNQGQTIYFDFGFLAYRPRVHDVAYALAFMMLALNLHQTPSEFPWERVAWLVGAYEDAAHWRLTQDERKALVPYTAAVPLFAAALDGFSNDPAHQLLSRLPFLRLSEWLLAHPEAMGS